MIPVVLDTNVVVSGLLSGSGPCGRIVELLVEGLLRPVADRRILAEYRDVVSRPELAIPRADAERLLDAIASVVERVVPQPLSADLPDEDDVPFLEVGAWLRPEPPPHAWPGKLPVTRGGTMVEARNPLTAPLPAEVSLVNSPLVRVICQVRFPPVLSLERREFVAPLQEAIRATYPVLRPEQAEGIVLGFQGLASGPRQMAWRFSDMGGEWRVSVTPEFVALETTRYRSREDFVARLRLILEAFAEHVQPARVQRLGVRYIDRVTGPPLADIGMLVRPEVLGIVATPLADDARVSLTETVFALPGSAEQLLARWGLVPAGNTVGPEAIEPVSEASWVLDLDMFSVGEQPFAPADLVATVRRYSERLYTVFRWAVRDEFLRRYGGAP